MGATICQECKYVDHNNVGVIILRNEDQPNESYAEPRNVDSVPCTVCHILQDQLNEKQIDAGDVERGYQIDNSYIIHPFNVYYTGEWKRGVPQGVGEIVLQNNSILKGTFVQGVANGKDCILVMDDGSYYRGGIQNNQFSGRGKFVTQNGHIYEGEWSKNVPNGKGQQHFPNGQKYEGNFKEGLKSDTNGTYTWNHHPDLIKYVGEFIEGRIQGEGTLTTKKGAEINGRFMNNNISNARVQNVRQFNYMDVKQSTNNLDNNEQKKDAERYQGNFRNGLLHGEGMVINNQGKKKPIIWFEGYFLHSRDGFSDQQIQQCLKLISQNFEKQNYEEVAIDNIIKKLNEKYPRKNYEAKLIKQTDVPGFKSRGALIADMRNKCLVISKSE